MIAHSTYTSTLATVSSHPHILKIQQSVLLWELVMLVRNFKVTVLIRFQLICQEMVVFHGLKLWEDPTFTKSEITVASLLWLQILNQLLKLFIHSMKERHGTHKLLLIDQFRLQTSLLNPSVSHNSLLFMEACSQKRTQVNHKESWSLLTSKTYTNHNARVLTELAILSLITSCGLHSMADTVTTNAI